MISSCTESLTLRKQAITSFPHLFKRLNMVKIIPGNCLVLHRKLEIDSRTVWTKQLIIQCWCEPSISKESFPKLEGVALLVKSCPRANSTPLQDIPTGQPWFQRFLFYVKRDVGNTLLNTWSKSVSAIF